MSLKILGALAPRPSPKHGGQLCRRSLRRVRESSQREPDISPVAARLRRSDYDDECGYTDCRRQIPSRFLCNRITTVVYMPSYLYELSSVSRKRVSVPAGGLSHPEETEPLTAKAKLHRQRDRIRTALAFDILASDSGVEAGRLWRHAPASGRAMARALDSLYKLLRGCPSAAAKAGIEAIKQSTARNEANADPQLRRTNPNFQATGCGARGAKIKPQVGQIASRKSPQTNRIGPWNISAKRTH
jgi:hypothetical protein